MTAYYLPPNRPLTPQETAHLRAAVASGKGQVVGFGLSDVTDYIGLTKPPPPPPSTPLWVYAVGGLAAGVALLYVFSKLDKG